METKNFPYFQSSSGITLSKIIGSYLNSYSTCIFFKITSVRNIIFLYATLQKVDGRNWQFIIFKVQEAEIVQIIEPEPNSNFKTPSISSLSTMISNSTTESIYYNQLCKYLPIFTSIKCYQSPPKIGKVHQRFRTR